ncbi:MAG: alpha/beta fold hydrolase [Candidatus Marinimicrobia bacterium]|nr:alpha/beta fold hydrolase [Candidatus Neomarinimicrobiota bacterium]
MNNLCQIPTPNEHPKANALFRFALLAAVTVLMFIPACDRDTRETVLNTKPHLEDSIVYHLPSAPRLCDALNAEKKYVDIGDCRLYCEIESNGIPLVLINGGPGGTHHCFHPWLTAASKDFMVIYYDQRGCGLSDYKPGEGYSFEQTVDDLENLRKALNINRWIVLGHSYGGAIAQYYTIKYPQHVIGQILVGAVPMLNKPEINTKSLTPFLNEQETMKFSKIRALGIAGKLTLPQFYFNKDINGGWKRENFRMPDRNRLAQAAIYDIVFDPAYSSDFDQYYFENAFDNCPIPTLICEGKYDSVWSDKKVSLFRKNHPNAQFKAFKKSSHNIYSDEPELFVETITRWGKSLKTADTEKISAWQNQTSEVLGKRLSFISDGKMFFRLIKTDGIAAAKKFYDNFKKNNPDMVLFSENALNVLGYQYMAENKIDVAIGIFELNVKEYPQSWNVWDSLGEAWLKKGDRRKARMYYQKSVDLNPGNAAGKNIVEELSGK